MTNDRYNRQNNFISQKRLKNIKVCIVGLGALGSVISEMLVRMGIGEIILVDYDTVETHNIAGQLFSEEDIGKHKVEALGRRFNKINSEINIITMNQKIVKPNQLPKDIDYVFSCVDNFKARKVLEKYQKSVNQKCVILDGGMSKESPTIGTNQMYTKGNMELKDYYPDIDKLLKIEQKTSCTNEVIPSLITTSTVLGALRVQQFLQHLNEGKTYEEMMHLSLGKKPSIDWLNVKKNGKK